MALASKNRTRKGNPLDERIPKLSLKANLTEDDINDLFYTPGIALLEQKQYMAAAAMFLQAKNICDSKKLSEPAVRYLKFFNMAKGLADKDVKSNTNEEGNKKRTIEETPIFKQKGGKLVPVRTYDDIAGMDAEKLAIENDFVRPQEYSGLLKQGKGVLFYGPPGTGKSFFIPAIAHRMIEALGGPEHTDIHLFVVSPAEIKGKYIGETEKNLKRYWKRAQSVLIDPRERNGKISKSIIFMDEFDALGGNRASGDANMSTSVNQLLQVLDGSMDDYPDVIFMAATNFPWNLDPAILRRFTMKIFFDLPGHDALAGIVKNALYDTGRVAWTKDERKRLEPDIDKLANTVSNMLGMKTTSEKAIVDAFSKAGIDKTTAKSFLENGDHTTHQSALFELGVSSSDAAKIIDTALNRIGMKILRRKYPGMDCAPLCIDDGEREEGESFDCKPCNLTPEEKQKLHIQPADVLNDTKEFITAAKMFGSNVNAADYVKLVIYNITGFAPISK